MNQMISFKEKIKYLEKNGLIKKRDKILIAFSGGPDSVFLFYLLNSLKNMNLKFPCFM